jgi:hypothetical protein
VAVEPGLRPPDRVEACPLHRDVALAGRRRARPRCRWRRSSWQARTPARPACIDPPRPEPRGRPTAPVGMGDRRALDVLARRFVPVALQDHLVVHPDLRRQMEGDVVRDHRHRHRGAEPIGLCDRPSRQVAAVGQARVAEASGSATPSAMHASTPYITSWRSIPPESPITACANACPGRCSPAGSAAGTRSRRSPAGRRSAPSPRRMHPSSRSARRARASAAAAGPRRRRRGTRSAGRGRALVLVVAVGFAVRR